MTIRRQAHISIPADRRSAAPMGAFVLALSTAAAACGSAAASRAGSTGIDQINHIVVIDLEGWSFDSLYGLLALIEHRFHLVPLGPRDAAAADLTNAFMPAR